MDLESASAAFTKFEGQSLAELLAEDVELEDAQAILLQQWESMEDSARVRWSRDPDDGPVAPAADAAEPPAPAPRDAATPSRRRAPEAPGRRAKKPRVAASRVKDAAAAAAAAAADADAGGAGAGVDADAGDAAGRWFRPGQAVVTCESSEDEEHDEETDEEDAVGKQRAFNRSAVVQGGKHPDWLTEPAAVAEISLPPLSSAEVVYLPPEVAEQRLLSSPQLESVAYAARRFQTHLPSGVRAGYYLGDGTGCGKGRVIAALVWHLWNSGAKRHVWLSASNDLLADATRDFQDIGADLPLCNLSFHSYGPIGRGGGLDADGNGIIFASYHLLVSSKASADAVSPETSRLGQLIDWMRRGKGGACGLIALDEAHRTKNVAAKGSGSSAQLGSKSGLCALELQRACPMAAVLYASATGATELRHLGYLERLGLWGPGRPHQSFEELRNALEGGGLAAMELLAMTMRAEGMLSCRSLSFKGASFRLVPVTLEGLANVYSKACEFWQKSLQLIQRLLKAKTREVKQKRLKHSTELKENSLHMRYFWNAQQQFFRQLLICTKVDTAVSLATSAQLRGESVVIAMWSTGESVTEAVADREGERAAQLAGFASAPKEVALRMLKELRSLASSLTSEPLALKDLFPLDDALERLQLPANPLDEIMKKLGGPRKVAELTGRSRRLVYNELTNETRFEDRGEGANLEATSGLHPTSDEFLTPQYQTQSQVLCFAATFQSILLCAEAYQELRAFQMGHKHVAIVTEAASAGISLHCDRRLPEAAQRPRYMISIEMPWERWLPNVAMASASWQQLRLLRHRDLLLGSLLRAFERDQLECRVLQSKAFQPHLNRWAELLVAKGEHGGKVDPHEVPPEVLQHAEKSSAEVKWVLRRLCSSESHHRGPPHFPSVLLQRGPQYPFQPFELTYLRSVVGSIRGTELNQAVDLPEVSEEQRAEALKMYKDVLLGIFGPKADKAIQQLGRVHRSNQKVPPRFAFVVTDLGGEVRFVSTVARRLRILGAMMRGDRNSAHGAVQSLANFDIQNRYGRQSLARLFELLRTGQEPEVSFSFLQFSQRKAKGNCWKSWAEFKKSALQALDLIGLRPDTEDKYEESLAESKNLNVFLNRLLMLEPGIQNALFDAVAELYAHLVELDRASGAYDGGPEVLDKRRGTKAEVRLVRREVLFEDPITGAETAHAELRLDRGMSWERAKEVLESKGKGREIEGFYWCTNGPTPVVLAVPRPRFRGVRAGASAESDDDSDADLDLHWPQGPPAEHHADQQVSSATLRRGDFFLKTGNSELRTVESRWRELHGASARHAGRWQEEHVLTGSILSTWAVLGTAIQAERTTRLKVQKIPLVRAKLADGGAIVGVKVHHDRLQEVKYVLSALHEERSSKGNKEANELDVRKLSAQLEAFLRTQPNQSAQWSGWAGAHQALVAEGLLSEGASGMLLAQEAFEDLDRNGKIDIEENQVQLRDKPKGCGWYIPPPKKPKAGRGRGRGRRGRA